jgi:EpsI family protein
MANKAWFRNKYVRILSIVLLIQAALFYGTSRGENIPNLRPLHDFPREVAGWITSQEGYVDEETLAVLKADDTLTRVYANPKHPLRPNLFVAYFRSQRTGKAPHSPKNCLPGSGWVPTESDIVPIQIPNGQPIEVNRYVVARGNYRSLVVYWYQSHNRVIASEYAAKVYLVVDSMRHNRSDTALVRVVVPITDNDVPTAMRSATSFIQAAYPVISTYLPKL